MNKITKTIGYKIEAEEKNFQNTKTTTEPDFSKNYKFYPINYSTITGAKRKARIEKLDWLLTSQTEITIKNGIKEKKPIIKLWYFKNRWEEIDKETAEPIIYAFRMRDKRHLTSIDLI